MQIGLIGGIGPGATDFYYRSLIEKFASEDASLQQTCCNRHALACLPRSIHAGSFAFAFAFSIVSCMLAAATAAAAAYTLLPLPAVTALTNA